MDPALPGRALAVVLNLALAFLVGASLALHWLRTADSPWAGTMRARLSRTMLAAAGGALVASIALLWVEAASLAEVPLPAALPAVRSLLTATHFGLAWTVGGAALTVLVLVSAMALPPRRTSSGALAALRILALGVLLYSRSMSSHAGAGGDFTLAVAIDWLHLLLVCTWVGDVLVAGCITLRRAPEEPGGRADCAACVQALSHSATVALAGIVATGAAGVWRVLDSPAQLLGNPYGDALAVKLGLVLCAAALGGLNRFRIMPALLRALRQPTDEPCAPARRFARILQIEAAVLVAVLAAAAVLTTTPPPAS